MCREPARAGARRHQVAAEDRRELMGVNHVEIAEREMDPGCATRSFHVNMQSCVDHATLPEQVVKSALRYRIAKSLVDAVMKDARLANGNLTGILGGAGLGGAAGARGAGGGRA